MTTEIYNTFMNKNNYLSYKDYYLNDNSVNGWEKKQALECMILMEKHPEFAKLIEEECDKFWDDYFYCHEIYTLTDVYRGIITGCSKSRMMNRIAFWISNKAYHECRNSETSEDDSNTDCEIDVD
jgi:hypothetical protein